MGHQRNREREKGTICGKNEEDVEKDCLIFQLKDLKLTKKWLVSNLSTLSLYTFVIFQYFFPQDSGEADLFISSLSNYGGICL